MNNWEIKSLQNNLERLDEKLHAIKETMRNSNYKKSIWLLLLTYALLFTSIAYIDLRIDFNRETNHTLNPAKNP